MHSIKKSFTFSGLVVFIVSMIVYFFSLESTGSLWDCGEFILGAYKLQVVHPPGAPLFMLIGRMFTIVATMFSDDPSAIAFSVNLMSGICSALGAVFAGWVAIMFGKFMLVGRKGTTDSIQNMLLMLTGIVAGLTTAFCSSIWFSAVEGEVYAMAFFFTAMTFWAAIRWYYLPDDVKHDKWIVFCLFSAGLSVGVHLLSLLVLPCLAILYYFKRYNSHNWKGVALSFLAGLGLIFFIQKGVVVGIPTLWKNMEIFMVNSVGMSFHSGLIPTTLLIAALAFFILRYAHQNKNQIIQILAISSVLIVIAFSTMGVIVLRANADTPVNMNVPSDALRLLPYLNREQYGERPLLYGPHYKATPEDMIRTPRYGRVGNKYEIVDEKLEYKYKNSDKMLFPRVGHTDRVQLHDMWREVTSGEKPKGVPGLGYNVGFFLKYQVGWMYWRYFMWNFVGRENGKQGYYPWDKRDGHWLSGIKAIDDARLYNSDELPDTIKEDPARNGFYFIPLIFGILGLFFHARKDKKGFATLMMLFLITGVGLIVYSNQPPNEPRERDYVLVGSFMAFSIWIGLAVIALYELMKERLAKAPSVAISGLLVLIAPFLMATVNFDDHSRRDHYGARDYASNFLNSVEKDAIIFTYGDNDTYPLWYAQEVEGIRRDVRVVNLSLIAVDWYIDKLKSKVNDSAPLKLTLSEETYRGKNRNQIYFHDPRRGDMNRPITMDQALRIIGDPKNDFQGMTILPYKNLIIPIDKEKYAKTGFLQDTTGMVDFINIKFGKNKNYILKDELAVMDVIYSNIYDRPIYFAITCKNEKLLGLNDFTQIEGLGLKIVPKITPSDRSLSIYGSGDVDAEIAYENIMTKWKWGNFDKYDTHINTSYMAGVQAMRMAMLRTCMKLLEEKKMEKANNVAKKFFEAFPHFNFPYDASVVPFINVMVEAKDFESAKKEMRILAEETRQYMNFYETLDDEDFKNFEDDIRYSYKAMNDLQTLSKEVEDPEFEKEIAEIFSPYSLETVLRR